MPQNQKILEVVFDCLHHFSWHVIYINSNERNMNRVLKELSYFKLFRKEVYYLQNPHLSLIIFWIKEEEKVLDNSDENRLTSTPQNPKILEVVFDFLFHISSYATYNNWNMRNLNMILKDLCYFKLFKWERVY